MTNRIHLGFAVRKTFTDWNMWVGRSICSYPQRLYATREEAEAALPPSDNWFTYDVTDVWVRA